MSEQLDTKALRALIHEYDELRPHLSREPEMSRASAIIYRLADAAPDLLDAADERDALRARVASLEGEVGKHPACAHVFSWDEGIEYCDRCGIARCAISPAAPAKGEEAKPC